MITQQEKLAAVEQLIVELRAFRNDKEHPMHWTRGALKEIARDLRAAETISTSTAILELERRVMAIKKNGSTTDRLNQLAHEFMARWPVIRRALLAIEREQKNGAALSANNPDRNQMQSCPPANRRDVAG